MIEDFLKTGLGAGIINPASVPAGDQPESQTMLQFLLMPTSITGEFGQSGASALRFAEAEGQGVLKAMKHGGIDFNSVDSKGLTALSLASYDDARTQTWWAKGAPKPDGTAFMTRKLLELGADPNQMASVPRIASEFQNMGEQDRQEVPLFFHPRFDSQVDALVGAGANVMATSSANETILMFPRSDATTRAVLSRVPKAKVADFVNARGPNGVTAFLANGGATRSTLKAAGADINAKNDSGASALTMAATYNNASAAELKSLIAMGVDVNVTNGAGVPAWALVLESAHFVNELAAEDGVAVLKSFLARPEFTVDLDAPTARQVLEEASRNPALSGVVAQLRARAR